MCALEGPRFTFISKLIDGTFPDYERVVPQSSDNAVTVDRGTLLDALGRIETVADETRDIIVGLLWTVDAPLLRLCLTQQPDAADDAVDAEISGAGRIAVNAKLLAGLIGNLDAERVHLDANGAPGPLLITNPEDQNYLALLMPCAWINHHTGDAA